jgi:hypothetical protein
MDGERLGMLFSTLGTASRRALLVGVVGGLLTGIPLEQASEVAAARNKRSRRNRRRNRNQTWKLSAHPLTHFDEHPASSGDSQAYNSKAQIVIAKRRRRYQICGTFQYYTDAARTNQINVKDVVIQPGNTSHTTPAVVTFAGWTGANVHDAGCQPIAPDLARQIISSPGDYHVNLRTNTPAHPNGAVAAPLTLH